MRMNKEKQPGKANKEHGKSNKGTKQRLVIKCGTPRRAGMWMNTCCLLLVIFAAFFVSCENTIISDWYEENPVLQEIAPQVSTLMPVTAMSLTNFVPTPFFGGTPVTSFAGSQYTGGVQWFKDAAMEISHSGNFDSGEIYTAAVTLTAAAGRTLSDVGANTFTHGGASTITNEAGSGVVTIVFPITDTTPAQTVNALNLTSLIPAPVSYGVPQDSVVSPQYRGNIVWKSTDDGTDPGTIFLPAVAYTATVTLTANSGWTFGPSPASLVFSHLNGVTATEDNMDGTITVTIDFQPTGSRPVTDLALTYNVPAPVNGSTPVTSFGGPQYTGIVDWWNVTDGADHYPDTDPFAAGKVYRATVTLTAAGGWTLADVLADTFGHAGASTVINTPGNPGPVEVIITFPVTGSTPVTTVTDLALTYNVPAPFAYGSPVTSFTGSQYTGMVQWYAGTSPTGTAHSGLFHPNTVYTAQVTLLPLAGWTFNGVSGTFVHQAVTNPANIKYYPATNPHVVTITFPKTGASVW
jgi:hypothetical protein